MSELRNAVSSSASAAGESYTFRCVLIADVGMMQTLWLPAKGIGRYRFFEAFEGRISTAPIIYIDGEDGKWVAHCLKGGFYSGASKVGDTWVLEGPCFLSAIIADKKYLMFVERKNVRSNAFQTFLLFSGGDITIGRARECDICYPNNFTSRVHAVLHWGEKGWIIQDRSSGNGVYLNGRKVTEEPVRVGDTIFIMGLLIIMGIGFISVNDVNLSAVVNSSSLG